MNRPSGVREPVRQLSVHDRWYASYAVYGLLLWLALPIQADAQYQYLSSAYRPHESLTYKVRWGFIRLGTIEFRQHYADPGFPEYMQVWLNGESATGLPFIDVYFRSTSLLNIHESTNILYELFHDRDEQDRTVYMYDPANARSFAVRTSGGEVARYDTLEAPLTYFDGLGLFMFTRCSAGSDTTVLLPTIMDFAMGTTSIRFLSSVEMVDVAAFDDDVASYPFLGSTTWESSTFAGMSGGFQGWVAADSSRILLKAEVKIFLGSVTIELESIARQSEATADD